jgi:hypothetical protein
VSGTYSGTKKNARIGRPPTSHCSAKAVRKPAGLVSSTKERTTPSPTVCMATMKKGRPPRRIPRSLGGAICTIWDQSVPSFNNSRLTSEA